MVLVVDVLWWEGWEGASYRRPSAGGSSEGGVVGSEIVGIVDVVVVADAVDVAAEVVVDAVGGMTVDIAVVVFGMVVAVAVAVAGAVAAVAVVVVFVGRT